MNKNKIAIGCDHAGFELKQELVRFLENEGYSVNDFGSFSAESVDYPDFIHPVSREVESGQAGFGVIICGSGNGAAMTANKHQGIRAALCWIPELAALAKQHNNANIISLPARYISVSEAKAILTAYLETEFEGGRHQRRIEKIPL